MSVCNNRKIIDFFICYIIINESASYKENLLTNF